MSSNRRLPAAVQPAAPSGCAGCGHPFTLHSNGDTGCLAAGCKGGPAVQCPGCLGTTVSLRTGRECRQCAAAGTVASPCPGFIHAARLVPELLAS